MPITSTDATKITRKGIGSLMSLHSIKFAFVLCVVTQTLACDSEPESSILSLDDLIHICEHQTKMLECDGVLTDASRVKAARKACEDRYAANANSCQVILWNRDLVRANWDCYPLDRCASDHEVESCQLEVVDKQRAQSKSLVQRCLDAAKRCPKLVEMSTLDDGADFATRGEKVCNGLWLLADEAAEASIGCLNECGDRSCHEVVQEKLGCTMPEKKPASVLSVLP